MVSFILCWLTNFLRITVALWDVETGEKMDKDRFRRDLGDLIEGL